MNSTNIIETCKQAIAEATAIIEYTQSIDAVDDDKLKSIYSEIRHDELGHLQKHVVALTELLAGEEPTEAEQMDEGGGESDE